MYIYFCLQLDGSGYGDHLSLNRAQFCEALIIILKKGCKDEVSIMFIFVLCMWTKSRNRSWPWLRIFELWHPSSSVCWLVCDQWQPWCSYLKIWLRHQGNAICSLLFLSIRQAIVELSPKIHSMVWRCLASHIMFLLFVTKLVGGLGRATLFPCRGKVWWKLKSCEEWE